MSDFTPIETQEQLNAIIGERISRAEQKAAEKYSDYDDVKKQNADYASQLADLQKQLEEQSEKIKGHQTEVETLNAKVRDYESSSLKTRIALETGLPYKMAERLNGTDENSIRQDAEMMVKLMGSNKTAPLGSPEPTSIGTPSARDQFKEWMNQMNE